MRFCRGVRSTCGRCSFGVREGDYFGAVLNRAARVMAAGHGTRALVLGRADVREGASARPGGPPIRGDKP